MSTRRRIRSIQRWASIRFVTLVLLFFPPLIFPEVIDFQEAASNHPNISHQYSFDGGDPLEQREDSISDLHLVEQAGGGATVADIGYGVEGFDESSEAVTTFRPAPGGDEFGGGANFRIPSIELGDTFSFEIIFRPGREVIEGGNFNLGYLLANRVDNDRGYFLFQGSAETDDFGNFGQDGDDLASVIGASFNVSNENTLTEELVAGDWYYAAGSYIFEDGETTFFNYLANLSAGDEELTELGPLTVGGSYGRTASGLSIGGRFDGPGEGFPGDIDEVNLYNEALDISEFDEHYLALISSVGEPDPVFKRGDVDGNGAIEITDPINNLSFQFLGSFVPPCMDAADFDDNGVIEITDAINNLTHQFIGGIIPADPGPSNCGPDPTPDNKDGSDPPGGPNDELGCLDYPSQSC